MKNAKKYLSILTAIVLLLGILPVDVSMAAKKVALSNKKLTVTAGKTKTLKLNNNKKSVKWTVISGKKNVTLKSKKKTSVKIVAKKKGTAKVQAKVGKKKYVCKVTVKAKTSAKKATAKPTNTPASNAGKNTSAPTPGNTAAPTAPATTMPTAPATVTPETTPTPTPTPPESDSGKAGLYDADMKLLYSWTELVERGWIEVQDNEITSSRSDELQGQLLLPSSVTSIGERAFFYCDSLRSIEIPPRVTSIGENAFENCRSLSRIVVDSENSVYDSRNDCNAIIETETNKLIVGCQSTIIPPSVTSIGGYAFHGCSSLSSIEIPTNVTSIGEYAFRDCSSLNSIEIPTNVTSIGASAFRDCYSLSSIEIPSSVMSIGECAFGACSSLSRIVVDSENSVYDSRNDCNAIIETETNKLIVGCQSTIIPLSVASIGGYAFHGCSSLSSIEIPESVTSIGERAFYGCDSLSRIVVDSENSVYDSRNECNAIIEIETNKLIVGCQSTIIPPSVTSIGGCAFYGCSSLSSIEIPESVTSIGERAFSSCYRLSSIEIPSRVTSIGHSAFGNCGSLRSIEIPESVTSIGHSAFEFCEGLTHVYCHADSKPDGWNEMWIGDCCSATVVWGYTGA